VERPDGRLDGERNDETEEDPGAFALPEARHVERPDLEAERDDRDQHEERPRERVDHELHRCRLEEEVEEEQVLSGEDADRRAREEEEEAEVRARTVAARPHPVADRGHGDEGGQADEPEREVVEADLVGGVEVREPDPLHVVLERARGEVEVLEGDDPDEELRECDEESEPACGASRLPGQHPND
jgi:hypothetical protein